MNDLRSKLRKKTLKKLKKKNEVKEVEKLSEHSMEKSQGKNDEKNLSENENEEMSHSGSNFSSKTKRSISESSRSLLKELRKSRKKSREPSPKLLKLKEQYFSKKKIPFENHQNSNISLEPKKTVQNRNSFENFKEEQPRNSNRESDWDKIVENSTPQIRRSSNRISGGSFLTRGGPENQESSLFALSSETLNNHQNSIKEERLPTIQSTNDNKNIKKPPKFKKVKKPKNNTKKDALLLEYNSLLESKNDLERKITKMLNKI